VVIDECVGLLVALWQVPFSWKWVFWGFVIFRLMDIFKPFPANWIDSKVKNHWGCVLDDVVAGIYTNLCLHLMVRAAVN
jgi:phosphatidylglycerophosphatase A